MNSRNKFFLILLLIGVVAILIGALNKLNGNKSAEIQLSFGLLMHLIAILGIIAVNLSKIKVFFSDRSRF